MPIWQGFCFTASHHLAHVAELTVSPLLNSKRTFLSSLRSFPGWVAEGKSFELKSQNTQEMSITSLIQIVVFDNHGFVSCMPIFGRAVKVFMCTLCTQVFAIDAHMAGLLLYSITSPSSCGRSYGESLLNSKSRAYGESLLNSKRTISELTQILSTIPRRATRPGSAPRLKNRKELFHHGLGLSGSFQLRKLRQGVA